eukprot:6403362-Amphidinium_carterae.1
MSPQWTLPMRVRACLLARALVQKKLAHGWGELSTIEGLKVVMQLASKSHLGSRKNALPVAEIITRHFTFSDIFVNEMLFNSDVGYLVVGVHGLRGALEQTLMH